MLHPDSSKLEEWRLAVGADLVESSLVSAARICLTAAGMQCLAQDRVALVDHTLEAPDDMAMAALGLSLGKMDNVRTQTLRAFDAAEVSKLLDKTV